MRAIFFLCVRSSHDDISLVCPITLHYAGQTHDFTFAQLHNKFLMKCDTQFFSVFFSHSQSKWKRTFAIARHTIACK